MRNNDSSAIHPDLRFPVFEIVLRSTTGVEEYEAIVNYYRETYVPGEKVVSLSVLGYGHSPELIHRTLAFALSPEVRTQDILTVIATLRSSVRGRTELWNFMQCHWDTLYERHCDDIRFLEFFILISIGSFSSLEWYHKVQTFFASKDTSNYERILATCLEGVRMHIMWLERDREDVERWLRVNGYLTAELDQELIVYRAELQQQQLQQHSQQRLSWPVNNTFDGVSDPNSMLGNELALTEAGRSRSSSSADGFSSSETYYTADSISSATSSCSSSPPRAVYQDECL
ncbi:Aminopeptidase 2 mitochondrial, partial [Entomortierella lignicola]